eukprot:1765195-Pleurochrysis_carterae.AAC.1
MGFVLIFRSVVTSSSASQSRGVRGAVPHFFLLNAACVIPCPPSCATHPAPLGDVSDSIPVVAFLCTR